MKNTWLDPRSGGVQVTSHCPLPAAGFSWIAQDGRRALTVVCNVTYELAPRLSHLAEDQEPPLAADIHWQDNPRNSLRIPSDLAPFKPRVDVLVSGRVSPPRGPGVRRIVVRLVVGALEKAIEAHGDRFFLPNGQISPAAELDRVALSWERAAGGPGTENPVGIPPAPRPLLSPTAAPTFVRPGTLIASPHDVIAPAGLGPLSPDWPSRGRLLGHVAAGWARARWWLLRLPEGLDAAYFNCAPRDQQLDHLPPDVPILLEHLHPEHPRLSTRLDGIVPRVVARATGRPDHAFEMRCDTLRIDADRGVCVATWRGTIAREAAEGAEIIVTADGHAREPTAAEQTLWAIDSAAANPHEDPSMTLAPGFLAEDSSATLPFLQLPPGTLPAAASASPREVPRIPGAHDDPSATLVGDLAIAIRDLPWRASTAPVTAAPATPAPITPAPITPTLPLAELAPAQEPKRVELAPFDVPPPAMLSAPQTSHEDLAESEAATNRPPPMLAERPSESPIIPALPAAPVVDPAAFPIERWATITAELDYEELGMGRSRADVLRDAAVPDLEWPAVDAHWKQTLEHEADSAGFALRARADAAYVASLERLRGREIAVPEYAKIVSAGEHRRVLGVLGEQGLPASAHLPIVRVWTGRLARDPRLSIELIHAVTGLQGSAPLPGAPASSANRGA